MKKIEAIIRPEKFQSLHSSLNELGIGGLTITEAAGTGKQIGQKGLFRGTTFQIQLLPKLKVETVVEDSQVEDIVKIIIGTCSTGEIGDGKIFIHPIDEVISIRTKESGARAFL
ncbi:P-II family nitrogen regulator [Ornithinibacillus californiensis]|jgi:nitrogen regulatory protein P-II 1|uniref:P-II family nitrogen regulator n=1 Tax=Ornithinibacillus californiensis TaxID=161536 RepID=UPI00064D9960|nr:P-II family nitrogen regulator [Ornithinibacillus californiensis]